MHANSRGGISIPIQVSGAAEAQRDIKDVADEVHEVSAAGGASVPVTAPGAARAKQELDSVEQSVRKLRASAPPNWAVVNFPEGRLAQAKEAAGAIDGISAQGEKAAKTILSLLNPALGGMLSLVIDLAQGIMKFSPALIVLTSVATAVGLITAALGAAAEARRTKPSCAWPRRSGSSGMLVAMNGRRLPTSWSRAVSAQAQRQRCKLISSDR
jgi:hypothetical protein